MRITLQYGTEVDIDIDEVFANLPDKYLMEEIVRRGIDFIPLITKNKNFTINQAKEIEEFLSKYNLNGRSLLQQM